MCKYLCIDADVQQIYTNQHTDSLICMWYRLRAALEYMIKCIIGGIRYNSVFGDDVCIDLKMIGLSIVGEGLE